MIKKIHFLGIGGSGVSGVASLASEMGYEVSGCDLDKDGHSESHLEGIDLAVATPAVFYQSYKEPEFLKAKKLGILITWQEFLGKILLKDKKLICIAGTHGKSTTTAMAGKLLIDNGFDPIVVLGANVPAWGGSSRFGKGEYAIVEADEFNNNFLHYHPEIAIINNIEFDHPDFFKNEEEVKESFKKFTNNLVGRKLLITEKDSLNKKFNLKIFGEHNQKNANMIYVLGRKLGIGDEEIVRSLESFEGIGRRMELLGERQGVKVYDDYAHHPTAIKTTLEGLREKYPDEKILAVVEPHGFKRTKALLQNYKGVFDSVDKVFIGPIFKARDEKDILITPELIAKMSNHKNVIGLNSLKEIIGKWKMETGNYDVVVVMGAGKSNEWASEILQTLGQTAISRSFKDLTTFRVGGKIKKYFEVKTRKEMDSAIVYANKNNLPIFVLGGGSDILVSDNDYNGVVIKYIANGISYLGNTVIAEAGAEWDKLVQECINKNLQGIECLSGIPGTVGGAPVQNIGAYGQELKDTFVSLTAFDIEKGEFVRFNSDKCEFSYRDSSFKKPENWQKYVITSITFKLNKNQQPKIAYDSLKNYLIDKKIEKPTLLEVRNAVLEIRKQKFESPKEFGNAGSFFKNPIINKTKFDGLFKKYPDTKYFEQNGNYKIFSGWLIEKTGWKGKTFGGAGVSHQHALILINKTGKAKAREILDLSERIIADVNSKFGIKLVREVQLINF